MVSSYTEESPFVSLLGQPARTKLLAAFVSERGRDLNVSYVADLAGVARSTVYDNLDDLQELGVVEHTRDVGGSPMYQLNENNEIAEELVRLEGVTLNRLFEMDEE
ncbi:winged helix-turn-helix domain-containing protein [Halorussus lipolyticus]|uniref:winged helix-turn-helix domain-containing protein n=1 Tax=Halorussus lipolyticus TaxID=3034024 RepID=UPI003B226456